MNSLYKFFRVIIFVFLFSLFTCQFTSAQGVITRPTKQTPQKVIPKVQVSKPDGYINSHGYVDLGLPSGLKWATSNIGASSPFDYGNYYAWGEIVTKSDYSENTCITYGKKMEDINGNPNYDAASSNWGGTWRLPTQAELQELIDQCVWTWIQRNNYNGYLITGTNGNSIFFPASGSRVPSRKDVSNLGKYCRYWSSTPGKVSNIAAALSLEKYSFNDGPYEVLFHDVFYGYNIRPVSP